MFKSLTDQLCIKPNAVPKCENPVLVFYIPVLNDESKKEPEMTRNTRCVEFPQSFIF
jgi:hypothetical protein